MVAIRHIWNQHILGSMRHLEAAQRSRTSCEMNARSSYDIPCQGQRLKSLIWQIILALTWGDRSRYCCEWKGAWFVVGPIKWAHQYHMRQHLGCNEQLQKLWLRKSFHLYKHTCDLKPLKTWFQSVSLSQYIFMTKYATFKVNIQGGERHYLLVLHSENEQITLQFSSDFHSDVATSWLVHGCTWHCIFPTESRPL